ncbi:AraC family transcriptional regulator [Gorillibacterium sp. sgz5001074]|uniref:AraC family transcriptional regulator n=1 Tax=Gorillibacterium sp. sgz5001074 TaxID=3446695 RepID=UPI003F680A49
MERIEGKAEEAEASGLGFQGLDPGESWVDTTTNRALTEFPVHCAFRTYPIRQPSLHSHQGYEWYLCLSGSGVFVAGGKVHEIGPGVLIIVKPMALHLPRSAEEEPFHRYVLGIDGGLMDALGSYHGSGDAAEWIRRWLPGAGADSVRWQLNARQLLSLQEILARLEKEIGEKRGGYELAAQGLLLQMFVALGRQETEAVPAEPTGGDRDRKKLAEGVLGYLTENYREAVHSSDLCRRFHLSRSYLHRIFKQETGVSIHEFLIAYRVNKAKELLKSTADPLAEIAAAAGFQDLSHFCHMFKRLSGMTPGQYRSAAAPASPSEG